MIVAPQPPPVVWFVRIIGYGMILGSMLMFGWAWLTILGIGVLVLGCMAINYSHEAGGGYKLDD